MLFKHKHLLEELRAKGRRGTAEILSMTTVGESGSARGFHSSDEDLTTTWFDCKMDLRVIPADRSESPFDVHVLTRIHTLKFKGSRVPVWYDPADHSKVVVDYEADVQVAMSAAAESEILRHRYEQRLGLAWTPVADGLLPLEAMTKAVKPGRNRVVVSGRLAGLPAMRDIAEVAVACVAGGAARYLPELAPDWFGRHEIDVVEAYGALPQGLDASGAAPMQLAIAVALVSLLSGRIVRAEVAIVGEFSSTAGGLFAVEGLREKAQAAQRRYAKRLVLPAANEPELGKLPARLRQDLEFVPVSDLAGALSASLGKHALKGFRSPA